MLKKNKSTLGKKKVVVGISGGVDSSVSAYLLKKEGYEVVGVFLNGWHPKGFVCDSTYDRYDAMKVCAHLGIPFEECDTHTLFNEQVIKPFFEAYEKGQTPNPDILCNASVKFSVLHTIADSIGAEYIATGHYAQKNRDGILTKAYDITKDQSYFLWNVSEEYIKQCLFPVGGKKKKEVRSIAYEAGLHTAKKKDSTGICFVGDISVDALLKEQFGVKRGDVWGKDKKIVSKHDGYMYYTIGQKMPIETRSAHQKNMYVVRKEKETNTLYVSPSPEDAYTKSVYIEDTHTFIPFALPCMVQLRHLGEQVEVSNIEKVKKGIRIDTTSPVLAVSGQSAVLYTLQGVCMGGGIIQ